MTNTDTKNLEKNPGATESKKQGSAGKPTTKTEQKKQGIVSTSKKKTEAVKTPVKPKTDEKKDNQLTTEKITEPIGEAIEKPSDSEVDELKEKPKEEKKKPIQKKPIVKKTEAIVNAINLPISTKYAVAICKFIKNKKIENAILDLEQVLIFKKAVPMKGEIPHRRGKGMMSGRYPKKATEHFIKLLKTLQANANYNELNNPMITEAASNFASRPSGRFGRWKRKRTHVRIIAKEKREGNKSKESEEKEEEK